MGEPYAAFIAPKKGPNRHHVLSYAIKRKAPIIEEMSDEEAPPNPSENEEELPGERREAATEDDSDDNSNPAGLHRSDTSEMLNAWALEQLLPDPLIFLPLPTTGLHLDPIPEHSIAP